jgi:hypothetical protein
VAADYDAGMEESEKIAHARSHIQSGIIWAASAAASGKTELARMAVDYCLAQWPVCASPALSRLSCCGSRTRLIMSA